MGKGFTKIYSTFNAFAALKADGSITVWGSGYYGGAGAPTDNGYTKIYSTGFSFAALKADGSITVWGYSGYGGANALLTMAIPRFIQLHMPLPPLKPMAQSQRGATQILVA
jgi:hypothetical protein